MHWLTRTRVNANLSRPSGISHTDWIASINSPERILTSTSRPLAGGESAKGAPPPPPAFTRIPKGPGSPPSRRSTTAPGAWWAASRLPSGFCGICGGPFQNWSSKTTPAISANWRTLSLTCCSVSSSGKLFRPFWAARSRPPKPARCRRSTRPGHSSSLMLRLPNRLDVHGVSWRCGGAGLPCVQALRCGLTPTSRLALL